MPAPTCPGTDDPSRSPRSPQATGLSRSTLYRNTALRAVVEHHKHAADGPITAITDDIATLRAAVSTLAERVRSHDEQLRRLRN